MLEKHGDRFTQKTFSQKEINYCDGKANPSVHFAGRFAAKEAIKKCFYSSGMTNQIGFIDIEILPEENGAPAVSSILNYKYKNVMVSISHESEYTIAMAILVV
ncbi:MAG: holo-ACP synthase [Candidatus Marinimicrobia bacterium]|nr:holo-ACP synthase [Candidatus Neomarinimicrobiota bacterium]MBT3947807.1 holo-ACP synthase [Candidatus Neomarinimicrobiota bacterium]MBT7973551.1 holo-ACP synthase [Candidatus Neomarinimicrobiota bacterium]